MLWSTSLAFAAQSLPLSLERIVSPILQTLVALAAGVLLGFLFLSQMPLTVAHHLSDSLDPRPPEYRQHRLTFRIWAMSSSTYLAVHVSASAIRGKAVPWWALTWVFARILLQNLDDVTAAFVADALA